MAMNPNDEDYIDAQLKMMEMYKQQLGKASTPYYSPNFSFNRDDQIRKILKEKQESEKCAMCGGAAGYYKTEIGNNEYCEKCFKSIINSKDFTKFVEEMNAKKNKEFFCIICKRYYKVCTCEKGTAIRELKT